MKKILYILTLALISCENSVPFEGDEVTPKMVAYAFIDSESTTHSIILSQSKPIFFESENKIFYTPPPQIEVNGESVELSSDVESSEDMLRYTFDAEINEGDKIVFRSSSDQYGEVVAEDIVPSKIEIINVETSWFQVDYIDYLRTNITIDDIKGEDNFYRVVIRTKQEYSQPEYESFWGDKEILTDQEPLFSEIPITIMDDGESLSYRIFSDGAFKDGSYTLNLYFQEWKLQPTNFPPFDGGIPDDVVPEYDGEHFIEVEIQTISESLYRYLHSLELQDNQDYTMTPIEIYSNVAGGYGVVGAYNTTNKIETLKY
ncbi:MAG: DUF4249 domain-containing protein [Rikenellaceae bacterium]